jgi:hypothetical protein
MKPILIAGIMFCLLVSCEDIIKIDLDSMESKMVIEGVIRDISDHCIVNISKTVDYFKPGVYPKVSDAIVSITDDDGKITIFNETRPGEYTSENLDAVPGHEYRLDVWAQGAKYSAETTMPRRVEIESLSCIVPPPILDLGEGLMVYCQVVDPPEEQNQYRMKAYNISDTTKASESMVLFNDDFNNGNKMRMDWEQGAFLTGDTVIVEIQTLDRSSYDFYRTMFSITGNGFFSASSPANPLTNLSNGALGYFGTCTVSCDTLVIPSIN